MADQTTTANAGTASGLQTTQGTSTPQGTVNFDPNTGAPLAQGQTVQINAGNSTVGATQISPDLSSSVQTPTTLNPTDLSSSQNANPTLPQQVSPDTSFVNSLQTGNPAAGTPSAPQLEQNVQGAQQNVDQTTGQINDLLQQLGMKGQDTQNMQNEANLPGLEQNLTDLNTQYAQSKAQYAQQMQNIGAQNIPSLFTSGQSALARAAMNSDLGAQAAVIQAAQGNLSTALSTINQTIAQKYQPIQDNLDAQEKYLANNQTQLTSAQQIQATRQQDLITAQKQQASDQQATDIQAQKDMAAQINAGLDAATAVKAMGDFLNGKISLGDYYTQIGLPQGNGSSATNPVVQQTMQMMGVPTDTTVANAITQVGMPAIINGLVQQEGGTPQGTNNPGNIKYAGQPGATEGKAATDGGNFANFATPADFQNAITKLVQGAADSGSNLSDFIASYKGVTNTQATAPGTTGSPTMDTTSPGYTTTALSNAGGLTQSDIDQQALALAMGTGTLPRGTTGRTLLQNTAIKNREGEMNAGGNIAANKAQLSSLTSTLTQNTEYANTTQRSYNTATANLGVLQNLMKQYGVNQSEVPAINQIENAVKAGLIDPGAVASFNTALGSLQAEYAQVLARGGTVTDTSRNNASQLIPNDLNPGQMQEVADQLSAEGQNAIKEANGQVSQIQGQINGIINPTTSATTTYTPGQTVTQADGSEYKISADGKTATRIK